MKRIGIILLTAVVVLGVLLTLNGDVSAKKRKGRKTPNAGQAVQQMANSRYVATIPNFTPAAGDYIIPNSDTVSTNFVLQGDTTGGGTWSTIPVTEYEIDPKAGYIVQRVTDLVTGTGVDWSGYSAYRLSAYTKSVSGTRTGYTNQTVTFAETDTGYSPIGQVGDINAAMLKNAFVNFVVAAGAKVVIDENGITIRANNSALLKWTADGFPNASYMLATVDATNDQLRTVVNEDGDSTNGTYSIAVINDALETVSVDVSNPSSGAKKFSIGGAPLNLTPITTPTDPTSSSDGNIYVKGGLLIVQYNDAGTVRYKYLDLTGTGVTWTHTTSAP